MLQVDTEVYRVCAYKTGVAGANEISQNGGHIQTSNLAALLQRVHTESWTFVPMRRLLWLQHVER